jgi:hypothetical protein
MKANERPSSIQTDYRSCIHHSEIINQSIKEAYIIRSWGLPCQSLTRMPNEKKKQAEAPCIYFRLCKSLIPRRTWDDRFIYHILLRSKQKQPKINLNGINTFACCIFISFHLKSLSLSPSLPLSLLSFIFSGLLHYL